MQTLVSGNYYTVEASYICNVRIPQFKVVGDQGITNLKIVDDVQFTKYAMTFLDDPRPILRQQQNFDNLIKYIKKLPQYQVALSIVQVELLKQGYLLPIQASQVLFDNLELQNSLQQPIDELQDNLFQTPKNFFNISRKISIYFYSAILFSNHIINTKMAERLFKLNDFLPHKKEDSVQKNYKQYQTSVKQNLFQIPYDQVKTEPVIKKLD